MEGFSPTYPGFPITAAMVTSGVFLPARLGVGSSITTKFLRGDGSWQTVVSGVEGFTGSLLTTSPNATINASRLIASGGSTNQDAVFAPKGTGAFLTNSPDNTSTGGNKRGQYAVDLQLFRADKSYIASGDYSVIGGGEHNQNDASDATIAGGNNNYAALGATGAAIAGGGGNSVNGVFGFTAGYSNSAIGDYSVALGYHTRTGTQTFAYSGTTAGQLTDTTAMSNMFFMHDVTLAVGNIDNSARGIRLYSPNISNSYTGAFYTSFKAGVQADYITYTLPTTDGTNGMALTTNGSGVLSWGAVSPTNVTSDGTNFTAMAVVGTTNINASGTAATNIGTGASAGIVTIGRVSGTTDFKSDITISGSTSGAVTLKAAPTTTPFNLTLPSSQSPGLRSPLYSDTSGNLSWGLTVSVPYSVKDSASMSGSGVNTIARNSTGFVYIAGATNVVIYNGTTYSTVAHGLVAPIYSLDANSTDSVVMINNTSTWRRSTDGGQTWGNITAPSSLSWNCVRSGGANGSSTVWCAIVLNTSGGQGSISTDNGATWSVKAITGAGVGANGLCNDGGTSGATQWLATMLSSPTTRISTDNGATWGAGTVLNNNCLGCIYLNGKFTAWDTSSYIYTATSLGGAWTIVKGPSAFSINAITYFRSKWYIMVLEGAQTLYSCTDITAPIWIREINVCPNIPPHTFIEFNSDLYLNGGTTGTGIYKIS